MEAFIFSVLAGVCGHLATDAVKKIVKLVTADRAFIARLTTLEEVEAKHAVLNELQSILIKANNGEIAVDGASLISLKQVASDHCDGKISMGNTAVYGNSIEVGGTGSGTTEIQGGTNLSTPGTQISVGAGCSIRISGNAGIKQG